MGDTNNDLSARLRTAAERKVGGRALTTRFGIDCFGLVDALLRSLGAETAADGDVPVTATADYDWGDGIMLESIQPGDILQFKDHVVDIGTWTYVNGRWHETDGRTLLRPHHTAIVVAVGGDGSVTVVEQNVAPNPRKVSRSVIPKLDAGEVERRVNSEKKIKIKVTGSVRAYRAVPKQRQGASLGPPAGWRALAAVPPAQGGAKRTPGPIGGDVIV